MNYSNTAVKKIKPKTSHSGLVEPIEFTRVNNMEGIEVITPGKWSYTRNKNILVVEGNIKLEILCTRCLSLVNKNFGFNKSYKIFEKSIQANNYITEFSDEYETIALEEDPSIVSLFEDEILFESSKIIDHKGCTLPKRNPSMDESNIGRKLKKSVNSNPFAKLKEKFRR